MAEDPNPPPRSPAAPRGAMYGLGAFLRHLVKGFTQEIGPERQVVRREVDEQVREGPGGERVTLRRTTIEEVEIDRPPPGPAGGSGAG